MKRYFLFFTLIIFSISCAQKEQHSTIDGNSRIHTRQNNEPDSTHAPDDCNRGSVSAILVSQGEDPIDPTLLYSFRSNILGCIMGPDDYCSSDVTGYVSYFYRISEFIEDNDLLDDPEFFENNVTMLQMAITVADRAINGASSDIVVTTDIYDFCVAQSTMIKAHPNYSQIQDIIVDLDADLEILHGKNKDFFVSYFQ